MRFAIVKTLGPLVIFTLLSGCAGMSGRFGCNATADTSCTPVSGINDRANAGVYDMATSDGKNIPSPSSQTFGYATDSRLASGYHGITPMPGQPVRAEERIQRIWIAPYQDLASNYHEPSYVYTVLEKSHWIGVPAQEIKTVETQEND